MFWVGVSALVGFVVWLAGWYYMGSYLYNHTSLGRDDSDSLGAVWFIWLPFYIPVAIGRRVLAFHKEGKLL